MKIYAGQKATNGVNGLPSAIVLAPPGGNAVENDVGITAFSILNDEGIAQNLDAGNSNRNLRMTGSVRLEALSVSPDPLSYFTVVEERSINSTGETPVFEWSYHLHLYLAKSRLQIPRHPSFLNPQGILAPLA